MQILKKYVQWLIMLILVAIGFSLGISNAQQPQSSDDQSAQITQLLKDAETYLQRQEFAGSYDLYQRVLILDPTNQMAREKIYAIANIYKTLINTALQEEQPGQAELYNQKLRTIIKNLLQNLTSQLEQGIQTYSKLTMIHNAGEDQREEIIQTLNQVITILQELQNIYTEFSEEDSRTEKMKARIGQTIEKYQQELAEYKSLESSPPQTTVD